MLVSTRRAPFDAELELERANGDVRPDGLAEEESIIRAWRYGDPGAEIEYGPKPRPRPLGVPFAFPFAFPCPFPFPFPFGVRGVNGPPNVLRSE